MEEIRGNRSSPDWVVLIMDGLEQDEIDQNASPRPKKIMYPVRRLLRDLNPEHYTPEEFHFGLLHRSPPETLKTRGEKCKLAMARAVLKVMGLKREDWAELCQSVVPDPKEMQDHYDEDARSALSLKEIQNVLTLDAVFLASFLGSRFCSHFANSFPSFREAIDPSIASMIMLPLMKDLFKVENQVPLSLIKAVLLLLVEKLPRDNLEIMDPDLKERKAGYILTKICTGAVHNLSYLLPGMDHGDPSVLKEDNCVNFMNILLRRDFMSLLDKSPSFVHGVQYLECGNFIDCMYQMMCKGMRKSSESPSETSTIWTKRWNWFHPRRLSSRPETAYPPLLSSSALDPNSDELPLSTQEGVEPPPKILPVIVPNVSELMKAGIQFRGRYGCFHDIDFKGGTLYLPILTLSEDNEAFWRNLVAYEDVLLHERDKSTHKCCMQELTQYFLLMDKLIDDANDVMVLKSGRNPVIRAHTLGTDQAVAHTFNNRVTQNCSVIPNKKWNDLHQKVYHYYNQDRRRMYWEFKQTHCSKPWLTVSVLVGILLLIATLLQTYYTVLDYYKSV